MDEMTDAEFLKHLADWQDDENRRSESVGLLLNIPLTERLRRIADRLESPWVSVDERLPEKDVEWILTKDGDGHLDTDFGNEGVGLWPNWEITHWMIIPPIYKGD